MYPNYFKNFCQRAVPLLLFFALAAPARALEGYNDLDLPPANADKREALRIPEFLKGLSRLRLTGSFSVDWREVGPKKPGFETQIQDEAYLSDMFFGVQGPVYEGVPFMAEWEIPTDAQGAMRLNQLFLEYDRVQNWKFQLGKFLVPFGRYNELYKPDEFLTITRPLLWASPDSLDLVVRLNSPRPPVSYDYTDIGARVSYYPPSLHPLIPSEITAYVVNGLSETSNRQRTFPDPNNLGIQPPTTNGVNLDFSHRNNNLADNNNFKSLGARVVFGLGDVRLPWPLPEEAADLKGMTMGFSGMGGTYDLESHLNYQHYGFDASFDWQGFDFSGEFVYSSDYFGAPIEASSTTLVSPLKLSREFEVNKGYFIQASYPLLRKPRWGKRVTGVLVFNQLFRRGPSEDLFLNYSDPTTFTVFPSLNAIFPGALRVNTRITKYTAAANYQLTDHVYLKGEYSYWLMGHASTRSDTSLGLVDIYQTALSLAVSF